MGRAMRILENPWLDFLSFLFISISINKKLLLSFLLIISANLSTTGYSDLLTEYPSGVYFGWAGLSNHGIYKMVMSIGWNPYFNNTEKTIVSVIHYIQTELYTYLSSDQ